MSVVAELYRRSRDKAAAYDREAALRETRRENEFLANLLEHASQPFAVGYPDGRLGRFNRAYEQLTGYTAAELLALDWSATLTPPEWRDLERQKLDELHRTGQPIRYEKEYIRKDGSRVPIELLVHIVPDAAGKPEYYYSFIADITERKRAESALQTTLQRFYAILSSMYSGVLLVTDEGRVEFANQAFCDLFDLVDGTADLVGLDARDMIEKIKNGYLHSDDAVARIREIVDRRQPIRDEEIAMQGGRVCLRDFIPLNVHGKSYGRLWIHTDITDRKQAEKALREREGLLQAVIDGSTSPIFLKDLDGKFITINASLERMLGMSREEIRGKTDYDIAPKEVADYWRTHDAEVTVTGKAIQIEEVAALQDGHHVFLADKFPLLDADGKVYGVGAISHDITERKRAEEARRESEERLRFALETIHTGAWDLDLVGHTAFRSLEHDRVFGYSEMLPEWTYEMFLEHVLPEDRAMVDGQFRRAIEGRRDWNLECRIRRTDGQIRWILAAGRLHQDVTGAPRRMAGIVQDITDRKQAEEALRKSERSFAPSPRPCRRSFGPPGPMVGTSISINNGWITRG